jgi:hypothetical protein
MAFCFYIYGGEEHITDSILGYEKNLSSESELSWFLWLKPIWIRIILRIIAIFFSIRIPIPIQFIHTRRDLGSYKSRRKKLSTTG